jgi:anthranilate synthase component 1
MMNRKTFDRLTREGYSRIPLSRSVPMGARTPLGVYRSLASGRFSCLLESASDGGTTWSRYSIIVPRARRFLKVEHGVFSVYCEGKLEQEEKGDPFELLRKWVSNHRAPSMEGLPPLHGGLVGYFAYDTLRYVEPRLVNGVPEADSLCVPDVALMMAEEIIAFDRHENDIKLVVLADPRQQDAYDAALGTLERLSEQVDSVDDECPDLKSVDESLGEEMERQSHCNFGQSRYEDVVERIREYILAGDVMQVVPSRRASIEYAGEPFDMYRALHQINPSPYMYFFNFDQFQIAGSSPEILARLRGRVITTRPIAGTRRRGRNALEDSAMERELLDDPKELAEHLMLIDLGRNDLGRVAQTGSVRVTERMKVERYSHVMHIVSTVVGELAEGDAFNVLKSVLPAGTLSGAPKIRAMEIIDELETVKRGIYGGAVGYIASNGDMDMAVTIRTVVIQDGTLYIQAGGGIVADSDPRLEWKETQNKARVMFRALALARGGS